MRHLHTYPNLTVNPGHPQLSSRAAWINSKSRRHALPGEKPCAYDTVPWGSAALETQTGDVGEEKRLLDIALIGRMSAGPGQTGGEKKADQETGKHRS